VPGAGAAGQGCRRRTRQPVASERAATHVRARRATALLHLLDPWLRCDTGAEGLRPGCRFGAGPGGDLAAHVDEPCLTDCGSQPGSWGGFGVRRYLPDPKRQAVGPFVFFDHFGPVIRRPEDNFDVRPHPHVGLATVTYLFEGAIEHRDSLDRLQRIEPGAINWMSAGSGIVHSERAPADLRSRAHSLHGLQLWWRCHAPRKTAPQFRAHRGSRPATVAVGAAQVRCWWARLSVFDRRCIVSRRRSILMSRPGRDRSSDCLRAGMSSRSSRSTKPDRGWRAARAGHSGRSGWGKRHRDQRPVGSRYLIIGGEPLDGPRTIW